MIRTQNLIKKYHDTPVLDLPDFRIPKGERFGLVGNNGAGKTTFFSLILDLIEATKGQVFSNGRDVKGSEHWKQYTGSYLDERFLIEFLTAEEYFEFVAKINNMTKKQLDIFYQMFEDFFNGEILNKNKYIREFSRGNQKKIGLAAAMMSGPDVLILDEPFPHLDPTSVIRLKNILGSQDRAKEITLLISSHDLNHVTEICERIAILEKGRIVQDIKTTEHTLQQLETYFTPET